MVATGFELSAAILHQPPSCCPQPFPHRCHDHSAASAKDPAIAINSADVQVALEEMKPRAASAAISSGRPAASQGERCGRSPRPGDRAVVISYRIEDRTTFSNQQGYSLLASPVRAALEQFQAWPVASPPVTGQPREGYLASGMPDKRSMLYRRHSPSSQSSIVHPRPGTRVSGVARCEALQQRAGLHDPVVSLVARSRYVDAAKLWKRATRSWNKMTTPTRASALLTSSCRRFSATVCTRPGGTPRRRDCARQQPNQPLLVLADFLGALPTFAPGT